MRTKRKVALITGGAGVIGSQIVKRLAADGFDVVINYLTSERRAMHLAEELKRFGGQYIPIRADISDSRQVKEMMGLVSAQLKGIDVLVHSAAVNRAQTFDKIDIDDFDQVMNINVGGTMRVMKYALPLFSKVRGGRVVFIASTTPFRGSPNKSAYTTSKAALVGLTRSLAIEFAPRILVNAVAPGYIDTPMFRSLQSESLASRLAKIPLDRIGKPHEVASVVSFLCSGDSKYITGQCIHVNGGAFFS